MCIFHQLRCVISDRSYPWNKLFTNTKDAFHSNPEHLSPSPLLPSSLYCISLHMVGTTSHNLAPHLFLCLSFTCSTSEKGHLKADLGNNISSLLDTMAAHYRDWIEIWCSSMNVTRTTYNVWFQNKMFCYFHLLSYLHIYGFI